MTLSKEELRMIWFAAQRKANQHSRKAEKHKTEKNEMLERVERQIEEEWKGISKKITFMYMELQNKEPNIENHDRAAKIPDSNNKSK